MDAALKIITLLPWTDWLALSWFFAAWVAYALFARHRGQTEMTVLGVTNQLRRQWMLQTTHRDVRVIDGIVIQSLSSSPSFFASTTILIIGGLLAVLGTSEKATELVAEIPFAARTSVLVFDLKVLVLTGVFVFAFFRFTWSLRQYTFGALMIASAPDFRVFERGEASRDDFAERAGRVVGLAAETFNDGLRAYYMAFALIGWFFSPLAFAVLTAGVIWVLYTREFRSEVLEVLRS
ncbi:DUF599 domain-containing protein [Caldimonas caldifontis]|uniref:DUF599 domain-containing protein n=1 Tax=Caldimonas caldifontis TaxID=1452508 RepID=A0A2S5SRR8_9BURK|nr:DUF599 domain-containing protein [Caldimonas caldifontis]PPE65435.1 DUF599 domain-containing protein [Caldimonas caldifontis]